MNHFQFSPWQRTIWSLAAFIVLATSLPELAAQSAAGVHREVYTNLTREAFSLARLTNHPNFLAGKPDLTAVTTGGLSSTYSGDDYAQRLRAYLTAPADGNYTFWISSDETSNLLLGADENPATKRLIAWVDPRAQPANYSTHYGQQSEPVALQAGRRYYVEVLHHEANLIDHLSVQWRLPAGTMESPIPNARLVYEIAPLIVSNLVSLTVEEGRPAVFAPRVANFLPPAYRWQRNSADIPGATNQTYLIEAAALSDHGALFRAFITNFVGTTNSAEVSLTVLRDTNAPAVANVVNANSTNVFVIFSEPVASASALSLANYNLPGAGLLGAELSADGQTVVLRTSPLTSENNYVLSISGVRDRASSPNLMAPAQVPFVAKEFQPQTIGAGSPGGTVGAIGGGANVTGGGSEIGGNSDQFQFAWQSVVGNFDFRVRVEGLDFTDLFAQAGLMARETLAADSRFAASLATPTLAGCFFQSRTNTGWLTASSGSFPASYPSQWLRLQRAGQLFSGFASQDGVNWTSLGSASIAMSNRLYLGFAVTSHNTSQTTTARFRQFSPAAGGTVDAVGPRAEPLGPSSRKTGLVISEIMYHPRDVFLGTNKAELEFVELYNSNPYYEDISGYRLSGDIEYTFPPNTVLQGGSLVVVARVPADAQAVYGIGGVLGPFTNNLPNDQGRIRLRNQNDFVLLEVNYDSRPPWPVAADGAGHSLVLARPSYGENQREAWAASDSIDGSPGRLEPVSVEPGRPVVINEFLAHTDAPQQDFIELFNSSAQAIDLGGAWLTDDPATNKFRLPSPTVIPARGFVSFNQTELGFSLDSAGEFILLVNSNQTRVIDALVFGPQANGVSDGRFPDGAPGFQELSQPTAGLANTAPLTRDIVINEIMYHPISENGDDEYVELFNKGGGPINLGGWRFTDGIDFRFPSNTVIAAGGYLVVARNRTNLLARYPGLDSNPALVVGDFDGNLDNNGERLALARPEIAINADVSTNITTNVIFVVVDEVEYRDGGRWGKWADGGGSSLELIDPRADNRLAPNWADSDETAKAPWTILEHTGMMDNGLATADYLHVVALEEGEYLLDDVEVFPVGSGNRVANGTFETGLTGWIARGTHERSSLENSGFNSTRSLRVRASSRGDHGANQVRVPLTAVPSGNTTVRARVRWLRGWPEVLLRLRGSFLEATDRMTIPTNLGTPGAPNSRLTANAGPAIGETLHTPVVPAANQAITVSARVSDVDGVASVLLKFRLDPSATLTTVAMNDAGTGGDVLAGDGIYSATIPGQPADTIVAFIIEATDSAGSPATSRFPALRDDNGPVRECLVHFGSPTPAGAFGTYRFWLTQQSITNWSMREVLSNERIPGTFVYGNHRVIYDSGSRYSGSAAHQDQAAPDYSPVGTPNNYTFDMPRDELVLGTDNFNKVHGAGNNHHDDNTLQRETTAYWMAQQLGLPANYKRFVAVFMNGARRGTLMEDTQVPNGEVIESVFPDDTEGDLYKISVWYEPTTGTSQVLGTAASSEAYLIPYTTTGGVKKRARYRWNWQPRAVHGSANDFTSLFTLVDVANAPTNAAYVSGLDAIADVENWMRTFALEHALGNWDSYGYRNQQNMFAYKPERGRWSMLIWDINIIFGGGTRGTPVATNETLFEIDAADVAMNAIYNTPVYRRAYWRALEEIAEGVFLNANADPVMDSRFAAFEASGVHVTAPNLIKHWISQRRAYVLSELAKVDAAGFSVAGPAAFTSPTNLITFSGVAPIGIHTILVNGVAWPVLWTTLTNWTVRVPVAQPTSQLVFLGTDAHGRWIAGASNQVTVNYSGAVLPPQGNVVISEIMYNPTNTGASFLEIFNNSVFAFDLSGWRINGLDYEFPAGSVLAGSQALALAKNRAAYLAAYGTNTPPPFDTFDGNVDTDGETLTLLKPGANGAADLIIDRVRYEARLPWAVNANGVGSSLQLIDPAQDNSRPSNWTDRQGWQQILYTGTIQGGAAPGTNFAIFVFGGAGDFYIDDIVLVTGAVANVGMNLVQNGDFEAPLSGSWSVQGNHSGSVLSTEAVHSGNGALHVIGTGSGNPTAAAVRQMIPAFAANVTCTMSYWFRPGTNGVQGQVRTTGGSAFNSVVSIRPANFTPGAANNDQRSLPAFDPLWLNELQAQNTAGPTDNFGEREPWIELYNAGPNTLSLEGYFLANNYDSNLTQWPFPPGSSIAPGQFRMVWADGEPGETSGTNLHTSFRLNSTTGSVALVRMIGLQPQITDYLTYANLGPALSYGDSPDGQPFTRKILRTPTPGAANPVRDVNVFINEWMASNTNTLADPSEFPNQVFDDWFELYNPGPDAVDLGGYWLTDNLSIPRGFQVPSNGVYVIQPGGFLLVWADEDSAVNSSNLVDLHVNFRLNADREDIGLFAPDLTLVDGVRFTNQVSDVSEGRFADGANAIYSMTTPTPRLPNTLGGDNTPPQLAAISDKIVTLGQTLSFTASATDAEAPPQILSFSLEGLVPSGAMIGAANGLFTWTPTAQQTPGTNAIIVRVTDNGAPPLSGSRTFTIVVVGPPRISGITPPLNGVVTLTVSSIAGKTYRAEYKNNLNDPGWSPLGGDRLATSATLTIEDNIGGQPQRFYRVLVAD